MTAQRIVRPATAFSVASTKQKRPREHNHAHLAFIRTLRCCICGKPGPDPAHIRSANPLYGKPETGMGQKAADKFVTPLCREHHDEQHDAGDELRWWESKKTDPFILALSLYFNSGDDELCESILASTIREARNNV